MDKSPEAFRTISEVAEALETPAHVLRFWESRFPQIRPVKRAGGRRYYRPADVALLGGIRHLLHDEGMTIRGVQKILREQGVRHVAAMAGGPEVDFDTEDLVGAAPETDAAEPEAAETAQVVALESALRRTAAPIAPFAPLAELHELRPGVTAVQAEAAAPAPVLTVVAAPAPPTVTEDAPEAPHIWVDAEPELELELAAPVALSAAGPQVVPVARQTDPAPRGLAARLRALPRPVSPDAAAGLAEVQSRLGLLHAQMAEASRLRR